MRTTPTLPVCLLSAVALVAVALPTSPQVVELPRTAPELVRLLGTRRDEVRARLESGQLSTLSEPALAAKDVALAIEDHVTGLPAAARAGVADAVQRLMLAAWQLGAAGDIGDQPKATHTYEQFSAAVTDLTAAQAHSGPGTTPGRPVTPRYTYAEHVFPIVRDRCGACHAPGGPAPISLLSHPEAALSVAVIREQLTTAAMPPWFVTPVSPAVSGGHPLSNRERDILLTWAAYGTPAGDLSTVPAPVPVSVPSPARWSAGTPDRMLELPEVTLGAGVAEERRSVTVATGFSADTWLRGVDVLPSDRSMVRSVTVRIEGGPVLGAWVPGDTFTPAPSGTAFHVPAGAPVAIDVHYRKHERDRQTARSDRTRIGLYVAKPDGPIVALTTLAVEDALPLGAPVRVLAIRTVLPEALDAVLVEAALTSGHRVPLLDLRGVRPEWGRRYWLRDAVALPAGAVVSVQVSGDNPPVELLVVPATP